MANEHAIPLLPCPDIDETARFCEVIGFVVTYRQVRPNPYVALRREDLDLHLFGMPGFKPEDSYGTCVVVVPDAAVVHAAFAAGMRAEYGKALVSGIPRMTRPRPRKAMRASAASAWLTRAATGSVHRGPNSAGAATEPAGRLRQAVDNAVVLGDSQGDAAQAAKILDGALARHGDGAAAEDVAGALAYRGELAVRLGDVAGARTVLARLGELAEATELPEPVRDAVRDLEGALRPTGPGSG